MTSTGKQKDTGGTCTCGKCVNGWLSMRMKSRLASEAGLLYFGSKDRSTFLIDFGIMSDFLKNGVLKQTFIRKDDSLRYIPKDLHPKMTLEFYQGYILVLEVIHNFIKRIPNTESEEIPSVIPTVPDIMKVLDKVQKPAAKFEEGEEGKTKKKSAHIRQCIQAYFSSEGKVEFGLDAMTDCAFEKSPDGTLYHQHQSLQEEEAEWEETVTRINYPRCENDMDFGLVREKLGLPREKLGPYWTTWDLAVDLEDEDYEGDEIDGEEKDEDTVEERDKVNVEEQDEATGKQKDTGGTCTCDDCVDGWFSPRMKSRLASEAFSLYDSITKTSEFLVTTNRMNECLENGVLTEAFILKEDSLRYIPKDLHPMMTPAFYQGYAAVMEAIFHVTAKLPESNISEALLGIPTGPAVIKFIDKFLELVNEFSEEGNTRFTHYYQCAQTYFSSGGKVEYGLDAMTDCAFEKSPDGTLYHQHQSLQEEEAGWEETVTRANYPRCKNDMDFGLVREKLGLPREKLGPYWFFPQTDREDDDKDGEQEQDEGNEEQDEENEEQDEDDSESEWETVYEIIQIPYW